MRKCIRCQCEMKENFDIKVEGAAYGLKIPEPGIFKGNLGKVRVAICPNCGYLEFYLDCVDKIQEK
ncbi:nucleic acid-binding protein [Floccifex sp.]|uniref:nucleic acid-binding protein n=1 Tax=Floccifex sp. TaxID=2815810 RepID=UPI003F098478